MKGYHVVDGRGARDLTPEIIDESGCLRVMPASYYEKTTPLERSLACVKNALYGLHTTELVHHLRSLLAGRSAIEIGAGNGSLAAALEIPATDNCMQQLPSISAYYRAIQQKPIEYGRNVEKLDACAAVEKYQPKVVLACWVTHIFDEAHPEREGNVYGVDEVKILSMVDTYVFIGNEEVHRGKPLWTKRHTTYTFPWLYSRAFNPTPNFIAVWNRASQTSSS